jgi:hypothetical protein
MKQELMIRLIEEVNKIRSENHVLRKESEQLRI